MKLAQFLALLLLLALLGYGFAEWGFPAFVRWAQSDDRNNTHQAALAPAHLDENVATDGEVNGVIVAPANALLEGDEPLEDEPLEGMVSLEDTVPSGGDRKNLLAPITLRDSDTDWGSRVNAFDKDRLINLLAAIREGNADSFSANEPDQEALTALLTAEHQPIDADGLLGAWRCRTTKVGGIGSTITTYAYFACRFVEKNGQLFFEKLSGSQRTSGVVYPNTSHSLVYLGTSTYNDDPQLSYSGSASTQGKDPENRDNPGVVVRLAENHVLLVFPYPLFESVYDILELRP